MLNLVILEDKEKNNPNKLMEIAKKLAAEKAATYLKDGMIIGIGTGSTVFYFIEALIQRLQNGLKIKAVSSSLRSTKHALGGGVIFEDINLIKHIDLTIDGADEIDPQYRMIKGGGGALLREKILASCSHEMIVIADETKLVNQLGKQKVPVEILPFAISITIEHINKLGFQGSLRKNEAGDLYKTDNQNYVYDIFYPTLIKTPEEDHFKLICIPGVIETGFFFNLAKKIIVGYEDGHIEEKTHHAI